MWVSTVLMEMNSSPATSQANEGVAFYREYREPVVFLSPAAANGSPAETVRATIGVGTLSIYTRGEN